MSPVQRVKPGVRPGPPAHVSVSALVLVVAAVLVAAAGSRVAAADGGADLAAGAPGGWLDVPFVKQTKNACGPATIAMVMGYWQARGFAVPGGSADPGSIMEAVYSNPAKGTPGSAMRRYFEQSGFRAFVFQGEWSDLEQHIGQGRPLIVALGEPRSFHYAVVAGVDTRQGFVLLNDPARRKLLRADRAGFQRAWNAAGCWTLLAVPGPPQ